MVASIRVSDVPDALPEHTTLLDVREQDEWDAGHAPHARHLPLSELAARVDEVPEGRVLIVCKAGGRSGQAAMWLGAQGHDVVNVDGGMLDWAAAGRPMVSGTGADPYVL